MSRLSKLLGLASLIVLLATMVADAAPVGIATTNADEWGPAAGAPGVVWNQDARKDYWIEASVGGPPFRVNPLNTWAWTGGIDGNILTYQLVTGKGSDVARYDLVALKKVAAPAGVNSRWWEYYPDASGNEVLFARTNVGYNMKREWRKIILVNTSTKKATILARAPGDGFIFPGQVSGNWATWFRCTTSCQVYLYDIGAKEKTRIPNVSPVQYSPAVASDGTLYYARGGRACGKNIRIIRRTSGGAEDVIYQFPAGIDTGQLYVYTDSTPQQNLYYDYVDCSSKSFRSDVYELPAADTAPPIVRPVPLSPAEKAAAARPRPVAPGAQPPGM